MYSHSFLIDSISKAEEETGESALAQIIEKILKESGIQGVLVNSRILHAFRKKIYILKSKISSARKKGGGSSVRRLLDQWKSSKHAFTVYYSEIDRATLFEESKELRGQKRILEDNVVDEVAKRLKVEEKLQQALSKSEKSSAYYKKKFKDLVRKVAKMDKKNSRGPQKKSFGEYTKRHQSKIKAQLKDKCNSTLSFVGQYDFIATKVEVYNTETQEYETIQLIDDNELPFTENNPKTLTSNDIDDINLWIYIKDKFNISDQAWKELAAKCYEMPNTYRIKKTH